MRIDLHTHSTASDGTDTPAELVRAAAAAGLDVVADHRPRHHRRLGRGARRPPGRADGRARRRVLLRASRRRTGGGSACTCWPTSSTRRRGAPAPSGHRLRDGRARRAASGWSTELAADGYPITWAAGQRRWPAAARSAARTSAARWSTPASCPTSTPRSATCCPRGSRTTCARPTPTCSTRSGWCARPAACRCSPTRSPAAAARSCPTRSIAAMAAAGLVGLEVDHPDHDADDRAHAAGLARDLGLIGTGSSDYHGTQQADPARRAHSPTRGVRAAARAARGARPVGG